MEAYLSLKRLWLGLKKLFWLWLALAVIIGGVTLVRTYSSSNERSTVSAVINYSYDGIEDGVDPAGNRFDPKEIKNEEVVRAALRSLDMDLSQVSSIRDHISVQGGVPSGVIENITATHSIFGKTSVASTTNISKSSYTPTQYTVVFNYTEAGLNQEQGMNVLRAVLSSYQTWFYDLYGYNTSIERSVESLDYSNYDYSRAVSVLDMSLASLQGYLQQLSDQDNTRFVSKTTGHSFSDLVDAIATIRSEDISRVSSYIEINNVTKNKSELVDYYRYKAAEGERNKTLIQDRIDTLDSLIDNYAKTYAVVVGGGTRGGEEEESGTGYYQVAQQSDTYDGLIRERTAARTELSQVQEQINQYSARAERLAKGTGTGSTSEVESRLDQISAKVKTLLENTNQTATEYFETVRLKQSFRVLSTSNGKVPLSTLVKNTVTDALSGEALLFGLYLLAAAMIGIRKEPGAPLRVRVVKRKTSDPAGDR